MNKQYTTIKNNYELTFDNNSIIIPCQDDSEIKACSFSFVKIADLVNVEVGHMVDLIGRTKNSNSQKIQTLKKFKFSFFLLEIQFQKIEFEFSITFLLFKIFF